MGETAENIQEETGISREAQDAFAVGSHRKAIAAWEAGRFDAEVVPVEVHGRKGRVDVVSRDEGPRADTSPEVLAGLRAIFRKDGSVTAGNSSSLNDGAAAILLASREAAEAAGMKPMALVLGSAAAGVDPRLMGLGPVPATRLALERAGIGIEDLNLVELNEAFAVQSLAVLDQLGLDPLIVNVNGGAIAIGHPLGCSGARITTTLLHEMQRRGPDCRYGLATMCIGVGQGVATVFERIQQ
jgi:acetyl-CoA acetyltransferase family protein